MKTFSTPIYLCLGLSLALMPTINQVQINSKNNPNYEIQQQEQLKSATDDFRARQLQVLREQSKKNNPTQK
jgi:hypothetical protein